VELFYYKSQVFNKTNLNFERITMRGKNYIKKN